jgi:hypothetical protein
MVPQTSLNKNNGGILFNESPQTISEIKVNQTTANKESTVCPKKKKLFGID